MTKEEINKSIISLKREIKNYIMDTPHYIVYWIHNQEIKDIIDEYPNDYENRVNIEVSSIDITPTIKIYFDNHPYDVEYITRYCDISNFREKVEKEWARVERGINEYRIKELQEEFEYHKRSAEEIEKTMKSLQK